MPLIYATSDKTFVEEAACCADNTSGRFSDNPRADLRLFLTLRIERVNYSIARLIDKCSLNKARHRS